MAHVLCNRPLRFHALYQLLTGAAQLERPNGPGLPDHLRSDVGLPRQEPARYVHSQFGAFPVASSGQGHWPR